MQERSVLQHVFASNVRLPGHVVVPPGDDLAAVRLGVPGVPDGTLVVLGVDQVIDGRHVRLDAVGPAAVGRKAIARAVSDIAAMAARPVCTLATAAVPGSVSETDVLRLFESMRITACDLGAPLVGGDLATTDGPLVLTVTVLGTPGPAGLVRRDGAKAGDGLYVTGCLGGAWTPDGGGAHLTFRPRVAEALELAELLGSRLHAGIDVSDGLGVDAGHVARASAMAIEIDAARLPCRGGCDWRRAAADGEDYEFLFAATGDVPSEVGGCPVTRIGRVAAGEAGSVTISAGDERVRADELGWEHRS